MPVRTRLLTATFDDHDYNRIRVASMKGKLKANFTRRATGEVTFSVTDLKQFCRQIEAIVDFGATSAAEVFDIERFVR